MNKKLPLPLKLLPIHGKRVLMRVDFNVPCDERGEIIDDVRIRASLPSIEYALEHGSSVILMSHLGRPKGNDPKLSLAKVAKRLEELLGRPVIMAKDCIGDEVTKAAEKLKSGQVLLLENLRFHPEEEKPSAEFVAKLASLGDVYVNDAFGTAHRSHASTAAIASYFKGRCAAGFLLDKELQYLGMLLEAPKRPFCALIGGAKISTKLGVLQSLIKKVDTLLIGGGMAYTFLKAQGIEIGDSICDDASLEAAKKLLEANERQEVRLLLPQDFIIADKISEEAHMEVVLAERGIPKGFQGVDIGPKTVLEFIHEMKRAKTIFWNGPVGVYECPPFARGTNAIAHALKEMDATVVIGGGDSLAAVEAAGSASSLSHLSTGGGASLEFLEQGSLPGVDALIAARS
jgi:phosphoglycerate kinase